MEETQAEPEFEFGTLLCKGIVLIIIGVLAMILINTSYFGPVTAADIPAVLLALFLIFFGVVLLCGRANFGKMGVASAVLGILVIIVGIIALCNPLMFESFLVFLIAAVALINGVFSIITGIISESGINRVTSIILGVIGVLVGLLIFGMAFSLTPFLTAPVLVYIAAAFLIICGIFSIIKAVSAKAGQKKSSA